MFTWFTILKNPLNVCINKKNVFASVRFTGCLRKNFNLFFLLKFDLFFLNYFLFFLDFFIY